MYRVIRTGHGKPGKSWSLIISFSRPGKSWNSGVGHGKSWKISMRERQYEKWTDVGVQKSNLISVE